MNKKKLVLLFAGLLIICIVLIVVIKGNRTHQSEIVYADPTQPQAYDDNGMYYFKGGYLMFMDNITGSSVPLCTKANCSHDSTDCDACYPDSHSHAILLYDDMIYISYFTTEYYTDSNGNLQDAGVVRIECCKKDGTGRKQVYECDTGAVNSMLAADGKLYYTAWQFPSGTVETVNNFMCDNYLYCYDMDWGITKKLVVYRGASNYYNASLELAESADKERLYLQYDYETDEEQTDADYLTEWITLDTKGKEIECQMLKSNIYIESIWVADEGEYVKYRDDWRQYDVVKTSLWRLDGTEEQLLEKEDVEDGISIKISELIFQYLTGYDYFIGNENLKLLIDYDEEQYYIAKSAVSDYHIVPDIYLIDKENDVVYYDTTDYTGVADGTTYSYDPTNLSCMKWSEFLEEYFVEYEGQEIEGLTIGDLD